MLRGSRKMELKGKAKLRTAEFMAVGKACIATFQTTPASKEMTFNISGVSAEETLTSPSAVLKLELV